MCVSVIAERGVWRWAPGPSLAEDLRQVREVRARPAGGAQRLTSASLPAGLAEKWPSAPRPVSAALPARRGSSSEWAATPPPELQQQQALLVTHPHSLSPFLLTHCSPHRSWSRRGGEEAASGPRNALPGCQGGQLTSEFLPLWGDDDQEVD